MKILRSKNKIIHATSVDINGRGIVIIGSSGSGKSNLAIKLMCMGANLISDDQTLLTFKDGIITISKPSSTPKLIEARGIGLISAPMKKKTELFYFIQLTNYKIPRFPLAKIKYCFGKKIKVLDFNPSNQNESALFLGLRYGVEIL